MDAPSEAPTAHSSVLRSATLASVTLLLDAKNLCELVGCSEEPGGEQTATGEGVGKGSGLLQNGCSAGSPEEASREGHPGAELFDSASMVKSGEREEDLGAGSSEGSNGSGQSPKGANEARDEENVDSLRMRTASCQGGAALALRLVERLLVEAVSPDWREPPTGPSELGNLEGGGVRMVSRLVLDGGQIRTGDVLDTLGKSRGPVLSCEQLLELVCVHCVLVSFLRRADSGSGKKAKAERGGEGASHSGASSDIGFGLTTLLGVLDYVEPSCGAPSFVRPVQLNAGAQLAMIHALSLARGYLEVPSRSAEAAEVQGAALQDVGGLAQRAVGLFKGSCLSALELAGFHTPTTDGEAKSAEEGELLHSMPAALALARALSVTSADLAAVVAGPVNIGTPEASLEELEGVKMGKAPAGEEGVKGVTFWRSSLQLAALTALSDVCQWLASHSESSRTQVESTERRGPDGVTEDESENLSDSLAPDKQGAQSAAEVDGLVAGCLTPDESAAAFLIARELVGVDAAVEDLGLEGVPNPLGQLLVYITVILRLEMEAGLETLLLAAFCGLLTSLVRLYSTSHPSDGAVRLATGVARGLVASFDVPAGAPLQSLVTLGLEYSPLEVAVSWAASAVSDCLETATRLVEDRNISGLESLEREERGYCETESAGLPMGAGEGGLEGVTDKAVPVGGGTKPEELPPQKSPDCEEAMLSWVENGGLKTEVPELEEEAGGVMDGSDSAPPVVHLASNGCRDQILDLALEFLVRTVERGAGSNRDGSGHMGKGHLAEDEGGYVELGLEPLTQIIGAFTAVCDADVAVELRETGAGGLLDERQGLRVLRGLCAALSPVEEGVLWLSDLCENALSEVGRAEEVDGSKGTGLWSSELRSREKPASGGSDGSEKNPPLAQKPAEVEMLMCVSEGGLGESPSNRTGTAGSTSIDGSERSNPDAEVAGEEPAAMVAAKTAHGDGTGAEKPDASQVEAAAELVRLGAAMHCAAERLVERKRGQWSAVAQDKVLQATLVRFRHQLEGLMAAYEACRETCAPTGLLDCLAPLCEDLRQAGFRVSDNCRVLTTDVRTVFPTTDAYESGREEAADLTCAGGLEGVDEDERTLSGDGALDARLCSDAEKKGLDAARKEPDSDEVGSEVEERGSDAKGVDSDSNGAEAPTESVPRTRSGRKSAAPSAWWAVVDQEKGKEERGAKRKASESVRKRESASEKRPKVAPGVEVTLVEQGGEMAEIDLEEEERRNDRRSKRRRKMLAVKKRKAAARGPSGNKFVAYALEEQMLDSESEWDSDEYSDMEDFIALENEEVDFKTMPLATITPYVPYEEPEEEAAALPEAQEGVA